MRRKAGVTSCPERGIVAASSVAGDAPALEQVGLNANLKLNFAQLETHGPPTRRRPGRVTRAQIAGYARSAAYRLNRITEIGRMGPGYVFIEEVIDDDNGAVSYGIWWFTGRAVNRIARRRWRWRRAKASQYGP